MHTLMTVPGKAGSVLGKRAYAIEITKALDGQTIRLGNADYNRGCAPCTNPGSSGITLLNRLEVLGCIKLTDICDWEYLPHCQGMCSHECKDNAGNKHNNNHSNHHTYCKL